MGRSHTFDLGDGGKSVPSFSFPAAELPLVSHTTNIANIRTFFPGTSSLPLWVISMVGPGVMNSYPIRKAIEYGINKLPDPVESKVRERGKWRTFFFGGEVWKWEPYF